MRNELAWTLCGVVSYAVAAFGCSPDSPRDAPRSTACSGVGAGECGGVAIGGRPLLFITANAATNQLALRITRDDGTTGIVAQHTSDPPRFYKSWSERRYEGVHDRRGTFPYMIPASENASVSPDGSWVLWQRDDDSWDVIDARDGEVVAIPETKWDHHVLEWSPDGKRFLGLDRDSCTLRVATPALARSDQVASLGASCEDPHSVVTAWWAPDGSWIAYMAYPSLGSELHTVRPDGSEHHVLATAARRCRPATGSPVADDSPWSPDGQRLVFVTLASSNAGGEGDAFQFRSATPDGTDSVVVLEFPGGAFVQGFNEREPLCDWSPDGDRLAITGPPGVFTVAARGDELHTLFGPGDAYQVAWSPDGARLGVTEFIGDSTREHTVRFDGENPLLHLTTHPPESVSSEWRWSSDGVHALLWTRTGERSEIHVYDTDSGRDTVLPDAGDYRAWTRDGARVIYTKKGEFSDTDVVIASVLADGSDERVYSVRAEAVVEMVWLHSGDGGDVWCGAHRDGLWCQDPETSERPLLWPSTASDPLIDFAIWDHAPVWQ